MYIFSSFVLGLAFALIYLLRSKNNEKDNIHKTIQHIIKWNKKYVISPLFNETVDKVDYIYKNISYKFFIRKGDFISNVIRQKHIWPDCIELYKTWKKYDLWKFNYLMDIGANIGACSVFMLYMHINVISFEPIKNNLHLFSATMLSNKAYLKNFTLYMIGLGNETKEKTIYINRGNWGASSLYFHTKLAEKIRIFRLDDIDIDIETKIGMMKIDVECNELKMLEGAAKFIKKHYIKIIYYEENCYCYNGIKNISNETHSFLESLGYKIQSTINCQKEKVKDVIAIRD